MVNRKRTKGRKASKRSNKSRKASKRSNKSRKASKRNNKKSMRGGAMRPLQPADVNAKVEGPIFVPNNVPFLPPGGGASTGEANGHKYYDLAQNNQKGGFRLLPESLVQIGRTLSFNLHNAVNAFQGEQTYISENPDVLEQPIKAHQPQYINQPIDVPSIQERAVSQAASYKPYEY